MRTLHKQTHQIVRKVFGSYARPMVVSLLAIIIAAGLATAFHRAMAVAAKTAFFATRLVAPGGADSGDCTGSPCLTITYAIGQASAGDTVSVAAGTYTENLTINKRLILDGAGSGAGGGDTIIQSAVIDTPVVNYSVGGADAVNRQVIKDVRLQNATSATVGATAASGILFVTSAPSGFLTIDNVVSTNNVGHGLVFNNGGGNNVTDVDIINSTFSNNRTGLLIRGGPYTFDGLDVSGSQFNGNDQIGLSFNPNGTVGLAGTNFTFLNTTFTQNGDTSYNQPVSPAPGLGFGDLSLFGFNGNASLTNVTVNGLPTNGAHIGVQFRGTNTVGPAGTISLNGVTVTGSYVRPINHASLPGGPGGGLFIQNYTDVSNVTFNDVDLLTNEGHQLFVAGVTNTLNVGDAEFGATLGAGGKHIALGTTSQNPGTLSPVNATGATFGGIVASTATLSQLSTIEDNILHGIDVGGLGLVRVRAGAVYVTLNSFFAPATTTPSIQRAVDLAMGGDTVNAGPGTYVEDININKTLIVSGDGPASTTISGPAGGDGATVRISANNVEFKNFKVTREGNTVATWNDPNLNSAGLAIQGLTITGANIHDNLITQNRTGIDINNSNGHTIRNNVITDNRTGLIFRNQTDNLTVVENEIANNWTVGIVFLDASGGTNVPVQTAANCTFSNNNLSANWYGQIVDRQSGGSLPAPGTTNLKNFSANWFGTTTPVVTTANSAEPGYAAQIPTTVPGGTATAPGGQPDIAGPASANFDITPLLDVATDTDIETTLGRGSFGFQGSFNVLNVIATNAQTGAIGRIQEGVNQVNTGGTVKTLAGTYTENADVSKAATLTGAYTINGMLAASVPGAAISPGLSPGIVNSGNLSFAAGSIANIELSSTTTPGTGHDQFDVVGGVNLGGATLNATLGFAPGSGNSFTIINNDNSDPVTGIFNGLPEGTVFLIGGTPFQITYAGGVNNNDVVLSVNCPLITVMPPTLPNGIAGVPYNQTISALPMGGGYTFAVTGGALPTGLTLMPDGTLSGTPMVDGTYTFTVTATGFSPFACSGSQTYTVTIGCPAVSLTPASLPNGTAGVAYNQTIGATPAGGNYTFSLTSGTLPVGITLAANGTLSGTPAQSGTFNFRVTAVGFGVCTNFRDYQLTIDCATITVNPSSLPGGTVGTAYNQTVSASPAGTYSYSVSSGALPTGLTLNGSTGAITGTPTTTGSFSFTITGTAGSCSGSQSYTVAIACPSVSFTTTSPLTPGQAGVFYSQTLNVTPAGSYTFSLVTGNLPAGLTLNPSTGVISGTPTTTGTSIFTVKALTANACSATQTYTLVIGCPIITVNPATLPSGTMGTAYAQTVAASPAGGSYTYAVSSGTLPAGLNLNPSTGFLSGVPSANGSFTFTITATGWGGCTGGRSYTVTISGGGGCPTITLPASLGNGSVGQLYLKSVAASPTGFYNYTASGSLPPGVTLFNNIGLIFGFPNAPGSYTFTITATAGACSGSQTYTVVIGAGFASSLTVFSDFDGDGKSDLSVFRGGEGNWLVANSGDGQLQSTAWGSSAAPYHDATVSGDYDGDGKTDLAVFRRGGAEAGNWYIKRSSDGEVSSHFWGLGTDVPVPGDYDGDGKSDVAVWRGSAGAWYIVRSSDGGIDSITWGYAPVGDVPAPGDYDGDGKTDVAVFRQSTGYWYIHRSSDGVTISAKWGVGTDVPVPGDYDGDNRTDIAVWRGSEGAWYIVESGSALTRTVFLGAAAEGDVPVAADYDGDGKADAALWRASTGTWAIQRSSDDAEVTKAHGQSGDVPIMARRN